MREKLKQWAQPGSIDIVFFLLVFLLLTIGIVLMYSASYVSAGYYAKSKNDPSFYFDSQLKYAVIGLVFMFLVSRIRLKFIRFFTFFVLGVSLILLVVVLIHPYIIDGKEDIHRWLKLPLLPAFQPSELAKFGLILFCAWALSKRPMHIQKLGELDISIPLCFCMTGLFCILIFKENHLSGTLLVLGIGAIMLVLGGVRKRWIVLAILAAAAGVAMILIFKDALIEKLPIGGYAQKRLLTWIHKDYDDTGDRWQTNQSLYAIGSGGLFGVGLGNSKQKHLYMPEPQNDFVFSIVCEELGFVGATLILLLFALLIWRGFVIALQSKNRFNALLVMGIMSQVALQTVLNVLVVTDTIPNTGISLPFFSYGGSSILVLLVEMGIVLSASRASGLQKK